MPWGLNEKQWHDLKQDQLEFNRRHSAIIERMASEEIAKNLSKYEEGKQKWIVEIKDEPRT